MDQFTQFGRVLFRGKEVVLGEENVEGLIINTGYFIEDGKKVSLSTYPELEYKIVKTFNLYTPAIDFDYLDERRIEILRERQVRFGDIDINEFMPECDEISHDAIVEMLGRIQKVFPFISSNYLMTRLPNLTIENQKLGRSRLTAAYFKPGVNVLGLCQSSLNDTKGRAYALHELSHMAGSPCSIDDNGKLVYEMRTGFTDEYYNGLGITEGLNELFSSVARLADPLSYDQEIRLATILYITSYSPEEIIKRFYQGDMSYLREVGNDDYTSKKFIKNIDYFTCAQRYDAERSMAIAATLRDKVIKETKKDFGEKFILTEDVSNLINTSVQEYMSKNVKPEFTQFDFVNNAQVAVLDSVERRLTDDTISTEQKSIIIDSCIKCLVLPADIKESAEYIMKPEVFEESETRFFGILFDMGFTPYDLLDIYMTQMESEKAAPVKTEFDDEFLVEQAEELFRLRDQKEFDDDEDDLDD